MTPEFDARPIGSFSYGLVRIQIVRAQLTGLSPRFRALIAFPEFAPDGLPVGQGVRVLYMMPSPDVRRVYSSAWSWLRFITDVAPIDPLWFAPDNPPSDGVLSQAAHAWLSMTMPPRWSQKLPYPSARSLDALLGYNVFTGAPIETEGQLNTFRRLWDNFWGMHRSWLAYNGVRPGYPFSAYRLNEHFLGLTKR